MSDILDRLHQAFDSYSATEKNIALRAAYDFIAAIQADAAPVAWMYERGSERKAYVERSQAALACGYAETALYAHPPVADRVSTSSPVDDRAAPNTSDKDLIERVARASEEVERLSRELDITNADHIALWLEGNTIQDEPMSQCVSWLACRIVEAHERAIAAMQADAAPVAWMYSHPDIPFPPSVRTDRLDKYDFAAMAKRGWTETPLYAHPPVADRVSTTKPVDDRAAPNTSVKLRDAVEVWEDAYGSYMLNEVGQDYEAAAAIIEQDREAVRAEQAAEVADYLKEGETIAECIARNRADANVLLEMFAAERVKVENYAKTMKIISDIANREAAELAKYKALAETLAGALDKLHEAYCADDYGTSEGRAFSRTALIETRKALRKWEEARDES